MRHLKVMGDLGKIIPMEIHLRNKDSLEAAVRHSDTVYNLIGRDYETKYESSCFRCTTPPHHDLQYRFTGSNMYFAGVSSGTSPFLRSISRLLVSSLNFLRSTMLIALFRCLLSTLALTLPPGT